MSQYFPSLNFEPLCFAVWFTNYLFILCLLFYTSGSRPLCSKGKVNKIYKIIVEGKSKFRILNVEVVVSFHMPFAADCNEGKAAVKKLMNEFPHPSDHGLLWDVTLFKNSVHKPVGNNSVEISEHYAAVPQRVRDGNISGYCPQRLSQSEDALLENIVMTCIKNLREASWNIPLLCVTQVHFWKAIWKYPLFHLNWPFPRSCIFSRSASDTSLGDEAQETREQVYCQI